MRGIRDWRSQGTGRATSIGENQRWAVPGQLGSPYKPPYKPPAEAGGCVIPLLCSPPADSTDEEKEKAPAILAGAFCAVM